MENGQMDSEGRNEETSTEQTDTKPARRFIIGSLRRAVRVREVEMCWCCHLKRVDRFVLLLGNGPI